MTGPTANAPAQPTQPPTSRAAVTSVPLHPVLAERWSPRAYDPDHEVTDAQLAALLEAARWAPSASNSQPWRFVVTRRGEEPFARLFATLKPGNQAWAGDASLLLLVVVETHDDEGLPRRHAFYDVGQSVAHLTVQAQAEGLAARQMAGFDPEAAARAFGLGERYVPIVALAVGVASTELAVERPDAPRPPAPRARRPVDELLLPVPPPPA